MTQARILVVEDDRQVADVVLYMLEKHGYEVESAADGKSGLFRFRRNPPDLVILDLNLPLLSGQDLFCLMRQQVQDVPVIMLTCQSDEIDRIIGLEMGADDYVTKPFNARELAARVRAVLRRSREPGRNRKIWREGPACLDDEAHRFTYFNREVELSRQEFELVKALVSTPARAYTRDDLILRMYDNTHPVTDRTVDACVKRIRKKLQDIRPGTDPIRTLYGIGYKFNANLGAGG